MSLNTLAQVLEKRGQSYVDKLLKENVIITEKLDTFRILFENINGNVVFFKKDNTPITLIERTLNDMWEPALTELPALINETKLPEGVRFGVAYTPVERPLRIPYVNLPKYILTDMSKREKGKIVESYDYEEVTSWAGILCMARPPILFEGILTNDQREHLINYGTGNFVDDYSNLSELVTKVFQNSYSNESIIEGIIIKSGDRVQQIISYEFDLLNEAYKKTSSSRDFYDIVLLSLTNFMNSYKFPVLESDNQDTKYLEIINDIFVKYCETEKISEGLEPKYLTAPQYGHLGKLNKKFITNPKAIELIKEDPIYEALYKVFLSSFRKYKKSYGLLTENVIAKFNTYVGLISEKTKSDISEDVKELTEINEANSPNVVVKTLKRRKPNETDNMKVISSVQTAFKPKQYNLKPGENRVAIYLTTYAPFTSSQMINIEQISNKWNVPVLIGAVGNARSVKGNDFHISDTLVLAQMRSLSNFNKKLIPSFMMLDTWNLKEIFEFCRPNYEPLVIITDTGKKSELTLQLFFEEELMGGAINVLPEFNIGEMENKEDSFAFRAIEDGNGGNFMELTPKPIHNFYDSIINEYRTWDGSIPVQFEPTKYPKIKE